MEIFLLVTVGCFAIGTVMLHNSRSKEMKSLHDHAEQMGTDMRELKDELTGDLEGLQSSVDGFAKFIDIVDEANRRGGKTNGDVA